VSDRDAYRVLHVQADAHPAVIRAAYHALAALYHPDRSDSAVASSERMAELNEAYARVRNAEARAAYDEERRRAARETVVVMPVRDRAEAVRARAEQAASAPASGDAAAPDAPRGPGVVDFGRYQGWTIRALARHDPDYLRWLSRHSAGTRFRSEIASALAAAPTGPTVSEKVLGRR
jgi:curved DNA-binding protein CbpA